MRPTVQSIATAALVATVTFVGCADAPTTTQPVADTPFFATPPAPGFSVIRRAAPLAAPRAASAVVGPEGALLEIPEAGVRLRIPAGALDEPTAITLRARSGSAMAFEMTPSGLSLDEPALLEVDLAGADPASLSDDVLGVIYEDGREGAVEPVRALGTDRSGSWVSAGLIMLVAGYATASG